MKAQLTEDAVQDLRDIYAYIAGHDSVERAAQVLDGMEAALAGLSQFPERGRYPPELAALGIREYPRPPTPADTAPAPEIGTSPQAPPPSHPTLGPRVRRSHVRQCMHRCPVNPERRLRSIAPSFVCEIGFTNPGKRLRGRYDAALLHLPIAQR